MESVLSLILNSLLYKRRTRRVVEKDFGLLKQEKAEALLMGCLDSQWRDTRSVLYFGEKKGA